MAYYSNFLASILLLVCVVSVSSYTPTNGPPRSSAIITDGTNTCGGVFIDSAFVLTTSSCAATLDFSDVTVTPVADDSIVYPASTSNPYANFGTTANGVSLIRLVCPGVLPSQIASGLVRFAEVATAAFETNSCLPQGTVSAQTQFAGISQSVAVTKRQAIQNIQVISLDFLGTCSRDGQPEASSAVEFNGTMMSDVYNCFNSSENPLEGSGVYVVDSNRFREIVIGLVEGTTPEGSVALVRVSKFAAQLARFIVDSVTGGSLSSERTARFARQQAIRVAIQSGQRPATLPSGSGSSGSTTSTSVDPQTARRILRNQQEAFFLESFAHSNWHQHTDGKSSIFSVSHLQARLESKHKRAPASAFDCPNANPGCANA